MQRPILITGGAGFIGTNLADALVSSGRNVLIYDDLSRRGVDRNLAWLRRQHGERVQFVGADIRDAATLARSVARAGLVFHLAAQVAVTSSLVSPIDDFDINARGTVCLLEALRSLPDPPTLLFTSTNKVYGSLPDLALSRRGARYEPSAEAVRLAGIGEARPLDFHSPYGCSKGAADQYVLDYGRTFGLPTVVFRMSCIYGPHQRGTEDQGWVAHFLLRALAGEPITIFGDGHQVRDLLFVDDLIRACLLATRQGDRLAGQAFNIGGGVANTVSLLELLDLIAALHGSRPTVQFEAWRAGDQRYYVTDHEAFTRLTDWRPRVGVREGIERLYRWLRQSAAADGTRDWGPALAAAHTVPSAAVLAAEGGRE